MTNYISYIWLCENELMFYNDNSFVSLTLDISPQQTKLGHYIGKLVSIAPVIPNSLPMARFVFL